MRAYFVHYDIFDKQKDKFTGKGSCEIHLEHSPKSIDDVRSMEAQIKKANGIKDLMISNWIYLRAEVAREDEERDKRMEEIAKRVVKRNGPGLKRLSED